MKPRVVISFALLLLTPLVALGVLGVRAARTEQQVVQHQFDELLRKRLDEVAGIVGRRVEAAARTLDGLIDFDGADGAALRAAVRREPLARQAFLLGPDGKLVHPPDASERSQQEEGFLVRTREIWQAHDVLFRPAEAAGAPAAQGWYAWYWDRGVNLIYWRRAPDGRVMGIEANRMALLGELVAELPASNPDDSATPAGRLQIVDADGAVLYAWGKHQPSEGEAPRVERALAPPLGSWRLRYFPAAGELDRAVAGGARRATWAGLLALVLAVAGLAAYFVRESSRELREARQRLSFVNQVSHELKTPLTNIRMYAELLEESLDEECATEREHVAVIVSESQRLSRLIANVLSFGRQQRGKLTVRRADGDVDLAIRQLVEQFRPSLQARGIEPALDLRAGGLACFDGDALGQILGNLLSNVEKYAAGGKRVRIVSRRDGRVARIGVSDGGPGIPERSHEDVFLPFVRLSGAVTDGVAGTGIGLSIARELARLHGGELRLEPSAQGACFVVELDVGPTERGEPHEPPVDARSDS